MFYFSLGACAARPVSFTIQSVKAVLAEFEKRWKW